MLALAFAIPPHFYFRLGYDAWIFLPFISLPPALSLLRAVWFEEDKRKLNPVLERTAQFMAIFGLLFSFGIVL
jgi:1,4-dihydroxy-2-naphthoate octaprenyltransferase